MFGGSEPVPCHGRESCTDGHSHGIGMDGVIAVFWTDLDPAAITDVSIDFSSPPEGDQPDDFLQRSDGLCHSVHKRITVRAAATYITK